jgi:hypothetical protein
VNTATPRARNSPWRARPPCATTRTGGSSKRCSACAATRRGCSTTATRSCRSRSTHWTALNPAIGALRGRFVIAGDTILSFYASPTGRFRGFESIQQRNSTRYNVRGGLLEEDKLLSTWALELTRL